MYDVCIICLRIESVGLETSTYLLTHLPMCITYLMNETGLWTAERVLRFVVRNT